MDDKEKELVLYKLKRIEKFVNLCLHFKSTPKPVKDQAEFVRTLIPDII